MVCSNAPSRFSAKFPPPPVLIQSLSGAYPAPNLSLSFPYPVLMRSLSNPYPILIRYLSNPYPVLILPLSGPRPVLIRCLSNPYPVFIQSLSDPYPNLIRSLSVKKNDQFSNPGAVTQVLPHAFGIYFFLSVGTISKIAYILLSNIIRRKEKTSYILTKHCEIK